MGGGTGGSESYSSRGRSRHNLENSLFGLALSSSSRETRERDKEAEREAREQRKAERERERLKERERSLREESVDGGFFLDMILCGSTACLAGTRGRIGTNIIDCQQGVSWSPREYIQVLRTSRIRLLGI